MPKIPVETDENSISLFEKFVDTVRLKKQYDQLFELWNGVGLLEFLPNARAAGLIGLDGKEYPIPTFEEVRQRIFSHQDLVKEKVAQGFNQLLLVPFGSPLAVILDAYATFLIHHHQAGTLLDVYSEELYLKEAKPISFLALEEDGSYGSVDATEQLAYVSLKKSELSGAKQPEKPFTSNATQTKRELLAAGGAWQLLLVSSEVQILKPSDFILKSSKPKRMPLAHEMNPTWYHSELETNPFYRYEEGMTIESWIALAMLYLERDNVQIERVDAENSYCLLTGSIYHENEVVSDTFFVGYILSRVNFVNRSGSRGETGLAMRTQVLIPA